MVRLVTKKIKGVPYLQAIHDYRDSDGVWKQKVLASFGRADVPENYAQGLIFEGTARQLETQVPKWKSNFESLEPLEKAFVVILGGAALAWLLSQLGK